jgi:hypothetical protein
MRDPYHVDAAGNNIFQYWSNVVNSGQMLGQNAPVGRVTISRNQINKFHAPRGTWRSYRKQTSFGQLDTRVNWPEKELFNIQTIQIDRRLDQSTATCEITLLNTYMSAPEYDDYGMGNPGYMTYTRGVKAKDYTADFGPTEKNEFYDLLRPNRVIHTYQGYGTDDTTGFDPDDESYIPPWDDNQLMQTGVWLIDSVTMHAPDALMTITCRDVSKLLVEQYAFPPLINKGRWPLDYRPVKTLLPKTKADGHQMGKYHSSSNNLTTPTANTAIFNHKPTEAFDGQYSSGWLSNGHAYRRPDGSHQGCYEWLQADCGGSRINEVKIRPWCPGADATSGYVVYISVFESGAWQGSPTIPYDNTLTSEPNNGSALKYVHKASVNGKDEIQTIKLPRTYFAKYVRITFGTMNNFSGIDSNASTKFRAGCRQFTCGYELPDDPIIPPLTNAGQPGVVADYSDIVKEALAWGGFFDPALVPSDPVVSYDTGDGVQRGAIWGDIEVLNSAPITPIGYENFTNKSLMDVVTFVKEIHGAIFFIDDEGGAVFRIPNIWAIGSYITDPTSSSQKARISEFPIVFDETNNLINITTVIDDTSLRSDFLVVGTGGTANGQPVTGGYTPGHNSTNPAQSSFIDDKSLLAGQIRVAFAAGEPVTTELEAQRMAELMAMQAHFKFRRSTITAPAHPGLHIDDQVKVRERITNDTYVHYVNAISTTMDLNSGEYTMSVETNWLGDDPLNTWIFNDQSDSDIEKYYTDALAQWQSIQNKQNGK